MGWGIAFCVALAALGKLFSLVYDWSELRTPEQLNLSELDFLRGQNTALWVSDVFYKASITLCVFVMLWLVFE